MVTLGGKDNGLEPRNHCVYRRTDGQPNSSIPPTTSLRGVQLKFLKSKDPTWQAHYVE
jgi:hypothetical protein